VGPPYPAASRTATAAVRLATRGRGRGAVTCGHRVGCAHRCGMRRSRRGQRMAARAPRTDTRHPSSRGQPASTARDMARGDGLGPRYGRRRTVHDRQPRASGRTRAVCAAGGRLAAQRGERVLGGSAGSSGRAPRLGVSGVERTPARSRGRVLIRPRGCARVGPDRTDGRRAVCAHGCGSMWSEVCRLRAPCGLVAPSRPEGVRVPGDHRSVRQVARHELRDTRPLACNGRDRRGGRCSGPHRLQRRGCGASRRGGTRVQVGRAFHVVRGPGARGGPGRPGDERALLPRTPLAHRGGPQARA
jgi:hypothetical protein